MPLSTARPSSVRSPRRGAWAHSFLLVVVALGLHACGGDDGGGDASVLDGAPADASHDAAADAGDDGGTPLCARNRDCDDGVFCNGTESCMPGGDGADARGCVSGDPPCAGGTVCDEDDNSCEACTPENRDRDGDEHIAEACGGDDCDDTNGAINPRATEVCDPAGVDEDCRDNTWGPVGPEGIGGDADGDRFISAMCCQITMAGLQCGDDCNDGNAQVNPDASEICNGLDDDCDGSLDPVLEDRDNDGWAGCSDLPVEMRDCDETNPLSYPGAPERCDGEDNDCDGSAAGEDLDEDDHLATDVMCEGGPRDSLPRTDCDDTRSDVSPALTERCDAVDHDCDGPVDEGPAADTCPDDGVTTWACNAGTCEVESCADTHGDCNGIDADGCEQPLDTRDHCNSCGNSCEWTCLPGFYCDDPVAISLGGFHSCAVTRSERVRCWGRNDSGQLGTGATVQETRPARFARLSAAIEVNEARSVQQVGTGQAFTCIRNSGGQVWCWGDNDRGQLGNGGAGGDLSLGRGVLSGANDLAVGAEHACVIVDGSVDCWGDNRRGQCTGSGGIAEIRRVFSAQPGVRVTRVVAGYDFSCALSNTGLVACWGNDEQGQLGDGTAGGSHSELRGVRDTDGSGQLSGVTDLVAGSTSACAVRSDDVVCWGRGIGALPVASPHPDSRVFNSDRSGQQAALEHGGTVWMNGLDVTSYFSGMPLDVGVSVGSIAFRMANLCFLGDEGLTCEGANGFGQAGAGHTGTVDGQSPVLPPVTP